MIGLRWVTVGLLVAAAAACVSGFAKGDPEELEEGAENPWIRGDTSLAMPAESQQISVVAAPDMEASASSYGKGHGKHHKAHKGHKSYKSGYHDKESYKKKKGHKSDKGHKKKEHGDYGKDHKKGYHDKGGKHYKGHEDKKKYYGEDKKGKKGKKGHHYGSKGHHNKGHKDKGFKNVYHKEEYHHQKKYYDDKDDKKYHDKYNDYDSYFKSNKGKDYKGKEYKGDSVHLNPSNTHSQDQPEEPLLITKVRAAFDKINDIPSNSIDERQGGTDLPVTPETEEESRGVMRFAGRILLDGNSRGRVRFQRKQFYDEQCQVHDLRMIRRYLMYCIKHSGDVGPPDEGAPPCSEEDLGKIKKYLNFCQIPFLAKASRGDKKQYKKLKVIAKKLDMRNNIIEEEEEVYQEAEYAAEVCNIMDLRQMKIYIEDCYSRKEPLTGRPSCEFSNYQKSLEYLSTCETFFLSKASQKDKEHYDRLLAMVSAMLQEGEVTEDHSYEEGQQPELDCQVGDLREAQKYVNGCKRLMKRDKNKREYGGEVCQSDHLMKINSYLIGCENIFLSEASEKDRVRYMNLMSTSELLGTELGEQSEPQEDEKVDEGTIECKIKDLRKIPRYLRSCDRSKSCEIDQLSKVYHFLVTCEMLFLQTASQQERAKYNELTIKAEMLSTRENIEQWREDTNEEKKQMESVCKIYVLRKIPKYLKGCYKSRDCKLKRLLKVQEFLSFCENFFTIAATPKDRGKYAKFSRWSTKLIDKGRYREARKKEEVHRRDKGMRCTLSDLRKIPKYLSDCAETNSCRRRQLSKVFKFLFMCEIPFTSTASRRDKNKYRKLMAVSEKLSLGESVTYKNKRPKNVRTKTKCSIKDLRKVPGYLSQCATAKKCKSKQLAKVHTFMTSCKGNFTKRASRKDKRKYAKLISLSKRLASLKPNRMSNRKQRKEISKIQCSIRDLRKIPGYLGKCAASKKCRPKELAKVHNFMVSCKGTLTKKASRQDKRKYAKLTAQAKKLTSMKPKVSYKDQRKDRRISHKQEKRRESLKHPQCKVSDLKKVRKYLTKCIAKRGTACNREKLNKIKKFLLSCKGEFFKKASKSDKKQYHDLIVITKKGVKQEARDKAKQKRTDKPTACKVRDLRKTPKYLDKCSKAIHTCKKGTLLKVKKFLKDCQSIFLKRASTKDRKQYKTLAILSNKLSQRIQRKPEKRVEKREVYPCDKRSLQQLEKHVKHCKAKIKRDKRRAGAYRQKKQAKAREIRAKRHLKKKQKSYPRKENERCKTRERRTWRKYRQGGKYHDDHGKKGHHEKGKYHDDKKGKKGDYDHNSHYGEKSSYGKKGGYKGDYGHDDYKGHDDHYGYGHDDHGHGYGHDDHGHGYGHDHGHGHGYGHDDHHGHGHMYPAYPAYPAHVPRMPVYCFRRDYCAPIIPPPIYSYPFPYF